MWFCVYVCWSCTCNSVFACHHGLNGCRCDALSLYTLYTLYTHTHTHTHTHTAIFVVLCYCVCILLLYTTLYIILYVFSFGELCICLPLLSFNQGFISMGNMHWHLFGQCFYLFYQAQITSSLLQSYQQCKYKLVYQLLTLPKFKINYACTKCKHVN